MRMIKFIDFLMNLSLNFLRNNIISLKILIQITSHNNMLEFQRYAIFI